MMGMKANVFVAASLGAMMGASAAVYTLIKNIDAENEADALTAENVVDEPIADEIDDIVVDITATHQPEQKQA